MRWRRGRKPSWTRPRPCRRRRKAGRSPCRRHRDADGRAGTHRRGRRRLPCTAAEPCRAPERQADGAVGPSEGRRAGPQPDRSAGKTGQRRREPPRRAGESLTALAARSGACQEEIEAIRRAKTDSTALIAAKEAEIREATEKRLLCQKDETEALAKGRAAADEREEMGREMARLAERKAAAEGEIRPDGREALGRVSADPLSGRRALRGVRERERPPGAGGRPAGERYALWATSTSAPSRSIRRSRPATTPSALRWRTSRAAGTS